MSERHVLPQTVTRMLVLQPTSFCNIDCDYCFLPGRNIKTLMTDATLRNVIDNLTKDNLLSTKLTILWHSGEPLVAGVDFYRRAFDMVSYRIPSGVKVTHSILTNGTLIDDSWAEFFLENDVRIGVSCDGPEFLHDMRRKTRSGQGTYNRVIRGIKTLQGHGIDFYVLSVLSTASLKCADQILQFAKDNSIRALCFNIEETEGINSSKTFGSKGLEADVAGFFHELLRRTFESAESPWIRELDEMFPRFFRISDKDLENHLTEPFRIVTVDAAGRWSTFSPELAAAGFCFGDLNQGPISFHIADSNFWEVHRAISAGVDMCRGECEYFAVCGGGAPSNKFAERGRFDVTETKHCRTMVKTIADVCMTGMGQYVLRENRSAS